MTSAPPRVWRVLPPPPMAYTRRFGHYPYLWARLLYHRGIATPEEAEAWLHPSDALLADPFLLPDMDRAVARLEEALASEETIAVFGDFDADGVTGCALLTQALRELGAHVLPYLPHRVDEGHGLNAEALADLAHRGATLLVTVDCGISSPREVAQGRELGLDVIVTDHHTPLPSLPEAVAVVDPRHPDARYPCPDLTGAGMAFKLAQALYQRQGRPWPASLVQLAAIGTVADLAPLAGENRYLVHRGLQDLRTSPLPGLRALMEVAGATVSGTDTEAISFGLAPRINAAGRVEHAATALQLVLARDGEAAQPLAGELERLNRQRQELTSSVLSVVRPQAQRQAERPLLLVSGDDLHPGVIGLAASKLVEEFYRPAVVVSQGRETSRASCRSIPEFNMIGALTRCRDLFIRYGGHPQAAGFDLPADRLPDLERRLLQVAREELRDVPLRPHINVDAEVPLGALTGETLGFLQRLAPFGVGNPAPVFLSRGVQVMDAHPVGANGAHLLLKLRDSQAIWDAVAFDQAEPWEPGTARVDMVFTLGTDRWEGRNTLRLRVLDWRPSRRRG